MKRGGRDDASSGIRLAGEDTSSVIRPGGGDDTSSAPVCALGHLPLKGKACQESLKGKACQECFKGEGNIEQEEILWQEQ